MAHAELQIELAIAKLLEDNPFPETEDEKRTNALLKTVLIPTPGHERSYTEIKAELEAAGVPVPPGINLLAWDEQHEGILCDGPLRPARND